MHPWAIGNRILDRQTRVQGRMTVLKNHLHIAAQLAQREPLRLGNRLAVKDT